MKEIRRPGYVIIKDDLVKMKDVTPEKIKSLMDKVTGQGLDIQDLKKEIADLKKIKATRGKNAPNILEEGE